MTVYLFFWLLCVKCHHIRKINFILVITSFQFSLLTLFCFFQKVKEIIN